MFINVAVFETLYTAAVVISEHLTGTKAKITPDFTHPSVTWKADGGAPRVRPFVDLRS